jgi:Leucine-rich repeat (LRR) protein
MLVLSASQLKSSLQSRTDLVLSHNAIEEIDEIELKPLTELRKLSLSHNLLRTVPNLSVGRM